MPWCCPGLAGALSRARRRPGGLSPPRFGVWAHCSAASLGEARRARNAIGRDGRCGPGRMPSDRAGRLKDVHVVSLRSRSGRVRSLPTVTLRGSTVRSTRPLTGGPGGGAPGGGRGATNKSTIHGPAVARTVPALPRAAARARRVLRLYVTRLHVTYEQTNAYHVSMWNVVHG